MDLRLLKTFKAVAEMSGFTRAARELHLTQSAVSAHIKALERELNAPLFKRDFAGVSLTKQGEILYEYARRILELASEAQEKISTAVTEDTVRVCLGVTDISSTYIPPVIGLFRERYPHVQLSVQENCTGNLIRKIRENELDLALILVPDTRSHMEITSLFEIELALVCPPKHTLAMRESVMVEDITNETLILYEEGCMYRQIVEDELRAIGASPKVGMESNCASSILQAVRNGLGVSILPKIILRDGKYQETLVTKPIRGIATRLYLGMLLTRKPDIPAPVLGMADMIKRMTAPLDQVSSV